MACAYLAVTIAGGKAFRQPMAGLFDWIGTRFP
jgi:hypothetical protein